MSPWAEEMVNFDGMALTLVDKLQVVASEAQGASRLAGTLVEHLEKTDNRERREEAERLSRRAQRGAERAQRLRVLADDLVALLRDFRREWQGE